MFNYLKKKLNLNSDTPEERPPSLFGLHLGGSFEVNDLKIRLIEDALIFSRPAKTQIIEAVGVVTLNDGSSIVRYYTDDDGFLQFILDGGTSQPNQESQVVGCKLWYFYNTTSISSTQEWDKQINGGISQASFSLEGKQFSPIWKDTSGLCPPVAMTEKTYKKDGAPSTTDQFIMVYETQVRDDLYEYVMIGGEESIHNQQVDRCLVLSTGIDLSESDFEVIG